MSGLTVQAGELVGVAPDDPAQGAELARRLGRYGPEADGAPAAELGGTPLRSLPVAEVRRRILVAQGDAQLFAGPLGEALGGPGASEAAVTQALHVAAAQDAVDAIPGGRRGLLASRGRTLSGGQAQRLRLARALLAEPEVLVLIEPTSAVDAHTEAAIASRLRAARQGRATVLITTSPLLLDAADRVAYLAGGRVTAAGRHRDLLSASPAYADAVTRGEDP